MKSVFRGVVAALICFVGLSLAYYWFVGRHYTSTPAQTESTTIEPINPSQPSTEQ